MITPVVMILSFFPEIIINILIGDDWKEAIPMIKILSPLLLVKLVSWSEVLGVTAMGRPDYRMYLSIFFAIITVSLLSYGGNIGLDFFIFFASLRYFIMVIPTTLVFCRLTGIKIRFLLTKQFTPIFLGLIIFSVAYFLYMECFESKFIFGVSIQAISILIYFVCIFFNVQRSSSYEIFKEIVFDPVSDNRSAGNL